MLLASSTYRHVLADAVDCKCPAAVITHKRTAYSVSQSRPMMLKPQATVDGLPMSVPVAAGGEPCFPTTPTRAKLCGLSPRLLRLPGRLTTTRAPPCWSSLTRPCTQVRLLHTVRVAHPRSCNVSPQLLHAHRIESISHLVQISRSASR